MIFGIRPTTLLLYFLLVVSVSIALTANLITPQFGDTAAYYYEGLLISLGKRPYIDFVENKNPGIYFVLALPALLGGWNMIWGVVLARIVDISLVVSTYIFLGLGTSDWRRRMFGTLIFELSYFSLFPFGAESIYTESFEILFGIWAYWLFLRGGSSFKVGLLVGLGVLFRQVAPFFLFPCIISTALSSKTFGTKTRNVALLLIGTVLPALALGVYASINGWFFEWIHFAYAKGFEYSGAFPPLTERLGATSLKFLSLPGLIVYPVAILMLLSQGGIRRDSKLKYAPTNIFLLSGIISHLAEASVSGIPYLHHLICLLPILSLSTVMAMDNASASWGRMFHPSTILYQIIIGWTLIYSALFGFVGITEAMKPRLHDESTEIGDWIKSNTKPEDSILVFGYRPAIYLLSQRYSASRFFHSHILSNYGERYLPLDITLTSLFDQDIREKKPKLIVLASSLDIDRYSSYVHEAYEASDVTTDRGTTFKILKQKE